MQKRLWTKKEDQILVRRYPKEHGSIALQKTLNRSRHSIGKRAALHGLATKDYPKWTLAEDDQICKL